MSSEDSSGHAAAAPLVKHPKSAADLAVINAVSRPHRSLTRRGRGRQGSLRGTERALLGPLFA